MTRKARRALSPAARLRGAVYDEDDAPEDPAPVALPDGSLPAFGGLGPALPAADDVPVTVCVAETRGAGGGETAVVTVEITVVTGGGGG